MCGRYYVDQEEDQIEIRKIINELNQRYRERSSMPALKKGEIFPTDQAAVLIGSKTSQGFESELSLPAGAQPEIMKWGFPGFGRTPRVQINARSETAAEKPMFKNAVLKGRLLVPASAWFEWQKPAKTKMRISLADSRLLLMAGLWRSFRTETGEWQNSFVIITRPAEQKIAMIHDRMPLIMPAVLSALWLNDTDAALHLLQQPPAVQLCYESL
jgi:putative SOS response-associated peptidase YedK